MPPENDDGSRRLDYAELEAEMNAMAMPERTPEVEAHFQRVFAASHDPCIGVAMVRNSRFFAQARDGAQSFATRCPDPPTTALVPTVEPSKK